MNIEQEPHPVVCNLCSSQDVLFVLGQCCDRCLRGARPIRTMIIRSSRPSLTRMDGDDLYFYVQDEIHMGKGPGLFWSPLAWSLDAVWA